MEVLSGLGQAFAGCGGRMNLRILFFGMRKVFGARMSATPLELAERCWEAIPV